MEWLSWLIVGAIAGWLAGLLVSGDEGLGVIWHIVLGLIGVIALVGGSIAGLIAWIGALLNTAQLPDKAWFIVLLVLGLFSFGFIAMLAYVIAGPDGTRHVAQQPQQPQQAWS